MVIGRRHLSGAGPRVCIVGGGAAGIAMAKTLLARRIEFDCFERGPRAGGLWAEGDGEYAVAYRSLHINSSKRQMQFSDYPFPDTYPDFPSRAQVASYLGAYCRNFRVDEHIELGRDVVDLHRTASGEWGVHLDDGERRSYDAVLIASGHHSTPNLPADAGRGFVGEVMHSHHVRSAAKFEGRKVLVVGFGNSAVDVASLISSTAPATYLSTRRGNHVIPKFLFGRPFDEFPAPTWPRSLRWGCYGLATRLAVGPVERYGLPAPEHRFGRSAVTISSDLLSRITEGLVQPRPGVAQLHPAAVSFDDGRREQIDTIVYCTGYLRSTPFLERAGLSPAGIDYQLFEQIWDPRFDGLAHIGLIQPLGSFFPTFEAQAEILADWIAGDYALPEPAAIGDAIDRSERRRKRRYMTSERHVLQVDEPEYRRRLERERRRGAARAAAAGRNRASAALRMRLPAWRRTEPVGR